MPKIDWIGKGVVVNHHREVAYRLVHCDKGFSAGDAAAGNLLVQGDNLEALRALLPYYAGRVKCIYIDPPYNTGNEGWVYNDRVNSPEIREWLGKVVGGEADDLCRHSKWLCMMYPRLRLLRDFLREDGVIFISIDDNEQHHLRMLMDEIFGANNFVANVIWQKKYAPAGDAKFFSDNHDFVICYAKKKGDNGWERKLLPRSEKQDKLYKYDDGDGKGLWRTDNLTAKTYSAENDYPIRNPNTGKEYFPSQGTCWRASKATMKRWMSENRVFFGRDGKGAPQLKRYLGEVQQGVVPLTIWGYDEVGHTDSARKLLKEIFSDEKLPFDNPKAIGLIQRIIQIAGDKNAIVMDSFAGSGTTAHAVLQQNKADGGNRKFVLVEMDKNISENITAKRIAKAIKGYKNGDKTVAPLGGGFHFCTLGTSLFDENGNIGGKVKFADLAAHIFFSETGTPIAKRAKTPLLGVCDNRAIYLLFNGVMGDNNALTIAALHSLPPPPQNGMTRVIYAESTLLSKERLAREKIEFRQIPYKIRLR